jgi:dihydrofolate reductase
MGRRIIGGAFVSLDGVIQAPGGPSEDPTGGFAHGGWLAPLGDEGLGNQIDSLFAKPFDLLLGRRTYDIFAAYWPFMPAEDPIASLFSRIGKHVLTRSDVALEWAGSRRLDGLDELAALKAEEGPDLVIQGSSTLYPQLLERGLLDRLVVMTAPVLLGRGKRLFGQGTPPRTLELVEHRVTRNGLAMATYDVAGTVETGSFAAIEPSPPEVTRQQKMARGDW